MDASEQAKDWFAYDQYPPTVAEIKSLVAENNTTELKERLGKRLTFGTAGLRARSEAGFSRINPLTVIQTSQGLAQYWLKTNPDVRRAGVVIGHDARTHSQELAEYAASAFHAQQIKVIWYGDIVHTPLVPFGVRLRGAGGGVMITASHNPKEDNGYKVYGPDGCQINTPEDAAIADSIMRNLEPVTWEKFSFDDQRQEIAEEYFARLAGLSLGFKSLQPFAYTPVHGVGLHYMQGALDACLRHSGKSQSEYLRMVPSQSSPDPLFPTVKYPNPEEDGVLDLSKQFADENGLQLIIANDPDADRLAIAQRVEGSWYTFKGDEVGVLLGLFRYQTWKPKSGIKPIMVTSAVSSQMLAALGRAEGFDVRETLTGFKWIGKVAKEIGEDAIFGYEEALGYMTPDVVRDKDGVSAALLLLSACSYWNAMPYEVLQDIFKKIGYFGSANTYWKSPTAAATIKIFEQIRANPHELAKCYDPPIQCRVRDLVSGTDTATTDGKSELPVVPDNLMLTFWLSGHQTLHDGVRCSIRASGTEPKIKVYVECHSRESLSQAHTGALSVLATIRKLWFQGKELQMEPKYDQETKRE